MVAPTLLAAATKLSTVCCMSGVNEVGATSAGAFNRLFSAFGMLFVTSPIVLKVTV